MFNCKESKVLGNSLVRKNSEYVDKQRVPIIDKLDYDCLAKVLTYIPPEERLEMEKVCEKWKEATKLSWSSVKKLDLRNNSSIYEKSKVLENCCQYLTHLSLFDTSSEWYEIMKNKCHNIIDFEIYTEHDETYEKIRNIITSMSKLKYLTVGIKITNNSIDPFTRLFDTLPNDMEEINLNANYPFRVTAQIHLELPDNLRSLRRLELRGFILPNTTIQSILLSKNTLVHLDLSKCKFPTDSSSMFSNLHNLEHLELNSVQNLNVDAIIHIAHNCRKLKHFEFSSNTDDNGTKHIPYRVFRELKYLNNLEYLDISNVIETTDEDGESFISCIGNNSELKYLIIDTESFTDDPNIDFKEIKKLKKLKYLNCGKLNSKQLIAIASNCLELETFNTFFGRNISRVALEKMANLEKLKRLTFFGLNNLTDDVLIKIISGCKNLEFLTIDDCKNIRGNAFIHFGKLEYLKSLSILGVANVPNAMFNNLHNLERLSCSDCPSITDDDIIKVIDNCRKLCDLDLSNDTGVTNKVLLYKSAKPRLARGKLSISIYI